MGKLHRDGRYTYKFTIYKDFQKAILPRMNHVQKRHKLAAVLQKGYRKHEFDGIKIAITLRGIKPRIEFYGNIEKILEYSRKLNLKPRIHNNTIEFNTQDTLKLLKTIINPPTKIT